jgi:hypothetical protein
MKNFVVQIDHPEEDFMLVFGGQEFFNSIGSLWLFAAGFTNDRCGLEAAIGVAFPWYGRTGDMTSASWRMGRRGETTMTAANLPAIRAERRAWNKGRLVGQKRPLLPKHVWAIRVRLEIANRARDLALFNLAIDSKLRGCDLVKLKVADVFSVGQVKERASIIQS